MKIVIVEFSIFQSFTTDFPEYIVNELEKIQQKALLWKNSALKTKHEPLWNDFMPGGLKMLTFQTKL